MCAVIISVVAGSLAACTPGPVAVPAPTPSAAARDACAALIAAVPATVLDQPRRRTTTPFTAAWGDPVITMSCGVAPPTAENAASQCFEVDGVGWYAEPGTGGFLFDTVDRATVVEVGVPDHYAPEANALVDLAPAISAHIPVRTPCL